MTACPRGVFLRSWSRSSTGSTSRRSGDLVEEGLRRELVRDEADAAQRRGADAGRLPELLGERLGTS